MRMNLVALFMLAMPAADNPNPAPTRSADVSLYTGKLKPLFAVRCVACHGALEQKGGLRVDTVAHMLKGGDSGPGLVPGKPAESPIYQRSAGHKGLRRMPPKEEGEEVGHEDLARLENWIKVGAPGPAKEIEDPDPRDHWAFRKPKRVSAPSITSNPIDAWIRKKWQDEGITPRPSADKRTLLRRAYLDLIGLPPTPEQIERFLADSSPDAYEREVDRLLKTPEHAERWARHFMDIWRYSDWWGLGAEVRNSQKNMWHWRDWIIESLEKDQPYDEMIRQMIAADELYPTDTSKLRATGYLARQYFLFNRTSWMDETIEHTSKAFLGLTANCSKCHDHKYDPLTSDEYYRLRAVFEPYQVRFDAPGGMLDPSQGFPRVYDCNLDKPTHKHIRGDENRPDTRRKMEPAIPSFLAFARLDVKQVKLPPEAHAPEIRPDVLDLYLKEAATALTAAQAKVAEAKAAVELAGKAPAPIQASVGKVLFTETFDKLDPAVWSIVGQGSWKAENGGVRLAKQAEGRTALKLNRPVPENFEITLRVKITGGEPWRSVGVSFDASQGRENNVYISANSGEPKLQIAFERNSQYQYPDAGKLARPIPLNKIQELTIRVLGTSVEAMLDGKSGAFLVVPDRQKGDLLLTAFAATCEIEHFEIRELPAGYLPPKAKKPLTPDQARAQLAWAEAELAVRELDPNVLRARYLARKEQVTLPEATAKTSALVAAKLEAGLGLLKARAGQAKAQWEFLVEGEGKKAALEAAQKALAEAEKNADKPGANFTRLIVSVKSAENNIETAENKAKAFPATSTGRRSALAKWMTHPDNPLTARVIVNHLWNRHFGQPLVPTLFDFGRKGLPPTHPEMLDTLAVELMEHGYSLRHLHKLMVTSQAYRLDSSTTQANESRKDPENRSLWRFPAHRMEAQVVRDSLLHLAGTLDTTRGGPPVPVADTASRRRSLYFFHSHNEHNRFLEQFDDAGVLECYRRERSIVPQQALALTHAALSLEAAPTIANRLATPGMNDDQFVEKAHLVLLGRSADAEEMRLCRQAIAEIRAENKEAGPERARALLVLALINHHDFLTRR